MTKAKSLSTNSFQKFYKVVFDIVHIRQDSIRDRIFAYVLIHISFMALPGLESWPLRQLREVVTEVAVIEDRALNVCITAELVRIGHTQDQC